jgi:trehalose-6-phosphate synthase
MVELKGSEKQIKWAEDLRKVVVNWVNKGIEKAMPKFSEKNLKKLEEIKSDMNKEDASWWIETFKGVKEDNLSVLFDYLNMNICGRKIASAINEIRGY